MKTRLVWVSVTALLVLILAGCGATSTAPGGSGASNAQATEVTITLSDFKIEASQTSFKVGVPYHFVVTNSQSSTVNHELMLLAPMSGESMNMEEMHEMALAHVDEDEMPPGATQSFDYTFQKPYAPGELEFACHVGSHYSLGMHTPVTVTQS